MIRYLIGAAVPVFALAVPTPAYAQAQDRCGAFNNQYEGISQDLATIHARGYGDNSAPRAAVRETEKNTLLLKASIIIELMKSRDCELPDQVPSYIFYVNWAMECDLQTREAALKRRSVEIPAVCDHKKWVRLGPVPDELKN